MESLAQSQHEVALLPWRIDSFEVFQESRNDIVTYHLQKAKIASKLLSRLRLRWKLHAPRLQLRHGLTTPEEFLTPAISSNRRRLWHPQQNIQSHQKLAVQRKQREHFQEGWFLAEQIPPQILGANSSLSRQLVTTKFGT